MKFLFVLLFFGQVQAMASSCERAFFHDTRGLLESKESFEKRKEECAVFNNRKSRTAKKNSFFGKDQNTQFIPVEKPDLLLMLGQANNIDDEKCKKDNYTCLEVSNENNQVKNYEADLKVCDCLRTRFNVPITDDLSKLSEEELEKRKQKLEEGKLWASLLELKKNYVSKRDAVLLEAHFVSDQQIQSLNQIAKAKETPNVFQNSINSFKGKVSEDALKKALESIDSKDQYRTVLDNLNENTKHPDSCFPYSEYLKVSMIPDSSVFWEEILNKKELTDPKEWYEFELLKQYKNSTGRKKELARAKLDFLNRNPTLKSIFDITNSDEMKQNVYKDLRKALNPSSGCVKDNTCRAKFFEAGGNLQKSLKHYYENQDIKELHIGQSFSEVIREIDKLSSPDTQNDLVIPSFRLAFNNEDVKYSQCNSSTDPKNAPHCVDMLKSYCSELYLNKDEILPQLQRKEAEETYTNNWIQDLEAVPAENQNYLKFQEMMCDRLARSYPFSNKVMNLQGFKDDYCSKNPKECEGLNDPQLFKLFISKTKSTSKVFDESNRLVEDDSGYHMLAQANSENKTAVREIDETILSDVRYSNSISNLAKKQADAISIREMIGCSDCANQKNRSNERQYIDPSLLTDSEGSSRTESGTMDVFNNAPFLSSNSLSSVNNAALSDARNELNEIKKEETAIKKEITQVKEEITASPQSADSAILESRLQNLEKLLAEKEQSAQSYQDLISKLLDAEKNNSLPQKKQEINENAEEAIASNEGMRKGSNSTVVVSRPNLNEEQHSLQRGPASVESFSTSGSSMLGGAGAIGSFSSLGSQAMKSSSGKINGALLSKYGIMVQENPHSNIAVAQEVESTRFQTMGAFKDAANIPLEVSAKAFEKFKVNDLSVLQELYKDSLENMQDEVIKILVSNSTSKETLEFYAIKEEGKVIFQPIRKMKLSDLQNVLTHY